MSDFRDPLNRAAAGFELPDDAYEQTLRRWRRRQMKRRLGAAAVAFAVSGAGVTGAWLAFAHRESARPGPAGHGTPVPGPTASAMGEGKIAYLCGGGIPNICVMNADGTDRHVVHESPYPQWDPAWSPDGTVIVFRGYYGLGDGQYALYVMNADGTGYRRLTQNIADAPDWSPDGEWIAFGTSGLGEVYKIHPDGSHLTRISGPETPAPGRPHTYEDDQPAWSPDRLAVSRLLLGYEGLAAGYRIFFMDRDGSHASLLTDGSRLEPNTAERAREYQRAPDWSYQNNEIVFEDCVEEDCQVAVASVDGRAYDVVTDETAGASQPQWLPNGRIAYLSRSSEYVVCTVNRDGTGRECPRSRSIGNGGQFAWYFPPIN
jgi:Tol biopolymer transport system component